MPTRNDHIYLTFAEEKKDNDNKSGINIVYLDKDMSFEMVGIDEKAI